MIFRNHYNRIYVDRTQNVVQPPTSGRRRHRQHRNVAVADAVVVDRIRVAAGLQFGKNKENKNCYQEHAHTK